MKLDAGAAGCAFRPRFSVATPDQRIGATAQRGTRTHKDCSTRSYESVIRLFLRLWAFTRMHGKQAVMRLNACSWVSDKERQNIPQVAQE